MKRLAARRLAALFAAAFLHAGLAEGAGDLSLNVYGLSYHPDREGARRKGVDNALNAGLGLSYQFHEDARGVAFFQAGFYRDSGRSWAKLAGPAYQLKLGSRWRLGAALLALHSHTYNGGSAFLATIPLLSYDFGAAQLNVIYAPRFRQNEFAVFGLYLSVPLAR